jgi:hypothetical protein
MAKPKPNDERRDEEANTEFEAFEDLARKLVRVPKPEADVERDKAKNA